MPPSNIAASRFTHTRLSGLRPIGKSFDVVDPAVGGLIVRVGPAGTKRWLFRYQWNGERTRIALGEFPEIGIAAAREIALAHRSDQARNRSAHRCPANQNTYFSSSPRNSSSAGITNFFRERQGFLDLID